MKTIKIIVVVVYTCLVMYAGYIQGYRAAFDEMEKNVHNHWEKTIYKGEVQDGE